MTRATNIPLPPADFAGVTKYAIFPREKRAFHTVLDAHKILAGSNDPVSEVRYARAGDEIVVGLDHPIADGRLREEMRLVPARDGEGLMMKAMTRQVFDATGQIVRNEVVPDFRHDSLGLPLSTYPEVALPFLLAWMPLDGQRRSVYAWINDRFIAKVYVEVEGRKSVTIGGTSHDAIEVIMYPDLNDWIPMGAMVTRLVKPFVPKYRMWYARQAPNRLVRFEGPYGPPGAPEVVLEIARS
jgi:hypothetical protein